MSNNRIKTYDQFINEMDARYHAPNENPNSGNLNDWPAVGEFLTVADLLDPYYQFLQSDSEVLEYREMYGLTDDYQYYWINNEGSEHVDIWGGDSAANNATVECLYSGPDVYPT